VHDTAGDAVKRFDIITEADARVLPVGETFLIFAAHAEKPDWLYRPAEGPPIVQGQYRQLMYYADPPLRTVDDRPLERLSVRDAHWRELDRLLNDPNPTNKLYAIERLQQWMAPVLVDPREPTEAQRFLTGTYHPCWHLVWDYFEGRLASEFANGGHDRVLDLLEQTGNPTGTDLARLYWLYQKKGLTERMTSLRQRIRNKNELNLSQQLDRIDQGFPLAK